MTKTKKQSWMLLLSVIMTMVKKCLGNDGGDSNSHSYNYYYYLFSLR
jgi:hypothetical protein